MVSAATGAVGSLVGQLAKAKGLTRDRRRGRRRKMRLCGRNTWAMTSASITATPTWPQDLNAATPARHRLLLRKRRRQDAGGGAAADERAWPDRGLRHDRVVFRQGRGRRDAPARRLARDPDQAPAGAGLHHLRPLRPPACRSWPRSRRWSAMAASSTAKPWPRAWKTPPPRS